MDLVWGFIYGNWWSNFLIGIKRTEMSKFFLFFLGSFLIYIFFNGLYTDPKKIPSNLIDQEIPSFSVYTIPSKKKFDTTTLLRGDKVKVVNFFASWCPPCKVEHPQLQKLSNDKDLLVLGINKKDQPDDLIKFLSKLGDPFNAIIGDPDGVVSIHWGVYGLPETFIVDKKGQIRHKHLGPIMKRDLGKIQKIIYQLKNE